MGEESGVTVPESPPEPVVAEGVTQAAPPPAETGVRPESPTGDRTLENWMREFQRRDQDRQKQMDSVLAYLAAQHAPRAPAAAGSGAPGVVSNDDLWALAQQGDRQAFEEYQRRIAAQVVTQQQSQQNRTQLVAAQMQALVTKYPVLRDSAHPLTQTAHQAYLLMVQQGYPATADTLLEAAKTAIADRPDIVSELHAQGAFAREQSRHTAASRAQTGVTGPTVRQTPASAPSTSRMSKEEAALAARMGIKDPKGAKDRFVKRQESGQSTLGAVGNFPAVAQAMEEL